jgi:hypothetical protein
MLGAWLLLAAELRLRFDLVDAAADLVSTSRGHVPVIGLEAPQPLSRGA